jgi:hypothetical protein
MADEPGLENLSALERRLYVALVVAHDALHGVMAREGMPSEERVMLINARTVTRHALKSAQEAMR